MCFLFNYGVATFHDEIGSGLSAARVKGGGGKLSIIAVHCIATMYHRHQGQVISLTIDYTSLPPSLPPSLQIKQPSQWNLYLVRNSIWRLVGERGEIGENKNPSLRPK